MQISFDPKFSPKFMNIYLNVKLVALFLYFFLFVSFFVQKTGKNFDSANQTSKFGLRSEKLKFIKIFTLKNHFWYDGNPSYMQKKRN